MTSTSLILSPNFCFEHAPSITWSELVFGLNRAYITASGVVSFAFTSLELDSSELHFELAGYDPNDPVEVERILGALADTEPGEPFDLMHVWAYLQFLRLYYDLGDMDTLLDEAEILYAELDYPENYAVAVRYMPAIDESSDEGVRGHLKRQLEVDHEFFSKPRNVEGSVDGALD